jgi:hypothetical protein
MDFGVPHHLNKSIEVASYTTNSKHVSKEGPKLITFLSHKKFNYPSQDLSYIKSTCAQSSLVKLQLTIQLTT